MTQMKPTVPTRQEMQLVNWISGDEAYSAPVLAPVMHTHMYE